MKVNSCKIMFLFFPLHSKHTKLLSFPQGLSNPATQDSTLGTSLVDQWLRLSALPMQGAIPGWGTKILHALGYNQKKKKKKIVL